MLLHSGRSVGMWLSAITSHISGTVGVVTAPVACHYQCACRSITLWALLQFGRLTCTQSSRQLLGTIITPNDTAVNGDSA